MPYPFQLPELGFAFDALEPHIDARTMEIHHGKHHAGYTTKFNAALEGYPEFHQVDVRGGWWHIRLADDRTCWIPAHTAELVAH